MQCTFFSGAKPHFPLGSLLDLSLKSASVKLGQAWTLDLRDKFQVLQCHNSPATVLTPKPLSALGLFHLNHTGFPCPQCQRPGHTKRNLRCEFASRLVWPGLKSRSWIHEMTDGHIDEIAPPPTTREAISQHLSGL